MADYAAVAAVLEDLPRLVRQARERRGMSAREVACRIGVGHTTVPRVEAGNGCNTVTAIALLRWLAEEDL